MTTSSLAQSLARPSRVHSTVKGGDVDGHQSDTCINCQRSIDRYLRPRRSDQYRSWRHEWSSSEYCR